MTFSSTPVRPTSLRAAVRAVGATKRYGSGRSAVTALDAVSVEFGEGRFTAVMGPSGSGKSTLMHCMAGLDTLSAGQAWIGDAEIGSLDDRQRTLLRRQRVGFVFQSFNLIPTLDAGENIVLPLTLGGTKPDQAWIDTIVATVGLGDRLHHRPSELSGGQQQRVAVARALASRPAIVFADEPTGNLDSRAGAQILEFLQHATRELGQSVVMVTHDPVAASYADAAVFLADGHLVDTIEAPSATTVLDRMAAMAAGR